MVRDTFYCWKQQELTGTFFCEMTTAQSFPLTPMEVMLAAVMALKAYSECAVGLVAASEDALSS
jgi:hypothetical protein